MPDTTAISNQGLRTPFHDAASAAVRKAFDEICSNWEGALGGVDVEAVHDLRVGTRRLRAALSVYEAAFPPREFARVERSMSALTDALGPARDTDVLIEHLEKVSGDSDAVDESERYGLRHLIGKLNEQRRMQQDELIHAMQCTDLEQISADLDSASIGRAD